MPNYSCWVPDYGIDSEHYTFMKDCLNAKTAVQDYVEMNFVNWEYPTHVEVQVCLGFPNWNSNFETYVVEVETVPSFYARKKDA